MKPRLVIFVKAPIPGQVKTRLAKAIGPIHATRVYRGFCAKILREMRDPRWQTVLFVTPDTAIDANFGGLWPKDLPRLAQGGGDLSPRTQRVFQHKGPVITIGTDTPTMKKRYIAQGFKALKTRKAVIGPARDGGFWLLGLNAPAPNGLFDNIRWSHPKTRADLYRRLACKPATLPMLNDIDTIKDYSAYIAKTDTVL